MQPTVTAFREKWELWKLERKRKKLERLFDPDLTEALKARDGTKLHRLFEERDLELRPVAARIEELIGRRIIREARNHDVDIPSYSRDGEIWESDDSCGMTYLTPRGRSHLRKLIDEEKTRRFDVKVRWVKLLLPLITALAGLIGVLTGLISVLHRAR